MYPASMRLNRLSFALLLPALEIAIWLVLVPTQTGLIYWRLRHGTPASAVQDREVFHSDQILVLNLPRVEAQAKPSAPEHPLFDSALFFSTFSQSELVTGINMPGVFVEALISMPTAWPDYWHPAGLTNESWRAIIMPFYCLPFWWFMGVGLDTAMGRRRLRWGWLLLGTIFFLLMVFLWGVMEFGIPVADRSGDKLWLVVSVAFWTKVTSIFPIASILQRKRSRTARALEQLAQAK